MEIKARIPGTIVAINVKPGDTVKARAAVHRVTVRRRP